MSQEVDLAQAALRAPRVPVLLLAQRVARVAPARQGLPGDLQALRRCLWPGSPARAPRAKEEVKEGKESVIKPPNHDESSDRYALGTARIGTAMAL